MSAKPKQVVDITDGLIGTGVLLAGVGVYALWGWERLLILVGGVLMALAILRALR